MKVKTIIFFAVATLLFGLGACSKPQKFSEDLFDPTTTTIIETDGSSQYTPESDCTNGSDDDGDGLIDCSDADCNPDAACDAYADVTETDCSDSYDNDGDGASDCDDDDCLADSACNVTAVETETECSDGIDDDNDGLVDCNDTDCATVSPCYTQPPATVAADFPYSYDPFDGGVSIKYFDPKGGSDENDDGTTNTECSLKNLCRTFAHTYDQAVDGDIIAGFGGKDDIETSIVIRKKVTINGGFTINANNELTADPNSNPTTLIFKFGTALTIESDATLEGLAVVGNNLTTTPVPGRST